MSEIAIADAGIVANPSPSANVITSTSTGTSAGVISRSSPSPGAKHPEAEDAKNGKSTRYVYRHGIVLADDFMKAAMEAGVLPLDGSFIVRLKRPVPCVFITFGYGGMMLPENGGLCVIGDSWNQPTKEESFALHRLMQALDPTNRYKIRSNWVLVDMKETDARVIRRPTDREIVTIKRTPSQMKATETTIYKAIKRIQRRRTTSGADIPDGHEDDSDRDPMEVLLADYTIKEEKYEKSRLARMGPWPDTEIGRMMHKVDMARKRSAPTADAAAPPPPTIADTAAATDLGPGLGPGPAPPKKRRGRPPGKKADRTSTAAPSAPLRRRGPAPFLAAAAVAATAVDVASSGTMLDLARPACSARSQDLATTATSSFARTPTCGDLPLDEEDLFGDNSSGETETCPESAIVRQRRAAASTRCPRQGPLPGFPGPPPPAAAIRPNLETSHTTLDSDDCDERSVSDDERSQRGCDYDDDDGGDHGEVDYGE